MRHADVDHWVRNHAHQMMFVYGQNDPWGAERSGWARVPVTATSMTAPGANHGAERAALWSPTRRPPATAGILDWAGVAPAAVQQDEAKAKPLAPYDAKLDKREIKREPPLRP